MDARPLSDQYSVAPQLLPEDLDTAKAAGFKTVICNRPDGEVPPELAAAEMQRHAERLGLDFVVLPFSHGSLTMDLVNAHGDAIANATGPVLAYCASGNRSSILWALVTAGSLSTDEIIARGAAAGYQLEGLRGQLDAMASP